MLPQPPLACPVSHQPLLVAPDALVARLQRLAAQRGLRNEHARLVDAGFSSAWISADRQRAWLIRDGAPDFRPGEAVLLRADDFAEAG